MTVWILVSLIVYLSLGVGSLIYLINKEDDGAYYIIVWWLIVPLFPYFIVKRLIEQ